MVAGTTDHEDSSTTKPSPTFLPVEEIRQKRLQALGVVGATERASAEKATPMDVVDKIESLPLKKHSRQHPTSSSSPSFKQVRFSSAGRGVSNEDASKKMAAVGIYNGSDSKGVEEMDEEDDEDLQAALAMSLRQTNRGNDDVSVKLPAEANVRPYRPEAFHELMWDEPTTTRDDQSRWMSQGIRFASSSPSVPVEENNCASHNSTEMQATFSTSSSSTRNQNSSSPYRPRRPSPPSWGLVQNHGGPCGVLAALQAEVLRLRLFDGKNTNKNNNKDDESAKATRSLLATAMARVWMRAAGPTCTQVLIVLPTTSDKKSLRSSFQAQSYISPSSSSSSSSSALKWSALDPWPWGYASSMLSSPAAAVASLSPNDDEDDNNDVGGSCVCHVITGKSLDVLEQRVHDFLTEDIGEDRMGPFHAPGGVLLFVMSLVETRGPSNIRKDMDDTQQSHLTSQFGHCSQELMNLLLTGRATTNVFDHDIDVANSGLILRGVSERPAIGYLTQLESLRYCTVGTYYKTPIHPVWVVGSTTHFTVLFAEDARAVESSESEQVLEKCRRVFRTHTQNGSSNGGGSANNLENDGCFVSTSALWSIYRELGLADNLGEAGVAALAAALEMGGTGSDVVGNGSGDGIVLWDDFWRATGRLMTGASLESVLLGTGCGGFAQAATASNNDCKDPSFSIATRDDDYERCKGDEEMARRLAAEFGTAPVNHQYPLSSAAVSGVEGAASANNSTAKTDEELARELQARFDAEDLGVNSVSATASASPSLLGENLLGDDQTSLPTNHENNNNTAIVPYVDPVAVVWDNQNHTQQEGDDKEDQKLPSAPASSAINTNTTSSTQGRSLEFERFSENDVVLHHYNGLRGGRLTTFRIRPLTPEEAVGVSVALEEQDQSRQYASSASSSGRSKPSYGNLEDVVRTRWPSCTFDWSSGASGNLNSSNVEDFDGTSLID